MKVDLRVPATSANIGAGFDSLGLAVRMYNRVVLEPRDGVEVISLASRPVSCSRACRPIKSVLAMDSRPR